MARSYASSTSSARWWVQVPAKAPRLPRPWSNRLSRTDSIAVAGRRHLPNTPERRRGRHAGKAVPDRPGRPAVRRGHDRLPVRVAADLRDPPLCTLPRRRTRRLRATQVWIHLVQGATRSSHLVRTPTTISENPSGRALRIRYRFGPVRVVPRCSLPTRELVALHLLDGGSPGHSRPHLRARRG